MEMELERKWSKILRVTLLAALSLFLIGTTLSGRAEVNEDTLVMELKYEPGESTLSPENENGLASFVRAASWRGRIEEIQLIAWIPDESATAEERALAASRLIRLQEMLSPYARNVNTKVFDSPEAGEVQGSVLVQLEK